MVKVYLDRNVDVCKLAAACKDALGVVTIEFIQWPLEGKNKHIKLYGFPAGEITWNDLTHVTWTDVDFCTWDDFHPTDKYETIVEIVGKANRGDCIHFDIAIKNGCRFYLTSDNHILSKKKELSALSKILVYNPNKLYDIKKFVEALLCYKNHEV